MTLIALLGLFGAGTAPANDLDVAQYRGKVVYLDFWASWCVPCRQSFPWMQDLQRRYSASGLVIIAVNMDQDPKLAAQFLSDVGASFPILYDPAGTLATNYQIIGMPTAVLLDRSGQVRFRHTGFFPKKEEDYEAHLRTLLHEAVR